MAVTARSVVLTTVRTIQRLADAALAAVILCFLIIFGLQFPHSSKVEEFWLIIQLHRYGDPALAQMGSWFNVSWPASSRSFLPIGAAFATWLLKVVVDAVSLKGHKVLGRLIPAPALAGADLPLIADPDAPVTAQTEQEREQLLKRYREIEAALKAAKRKRCAFLSVDVVGSATMKVGEQDSKIAATFQAYEEMVKKVLNQYGAWKQAWTPDGIMVCFLQFELAVAAAQRILQSLKKFNESDNKLRTPFRVRCGLNEGEVPIYEDSKLEKLADRVIDVAGHMQKQGNPNTLWISDEAYKILSDKSGFRETGIVVDGFKTLEWSAEPFTVAADTGKAVAGSST